ncbi:hypothetical protein IWQ60_011217 [Tieghemiomyces parasiticus]|uniref:DH domain-containing protein n=1 Tax=Tieghemiomyces parasiticus TaxID=78921 RepID=A0A9W7ZHP8_9FUNG|nr:hypothetical protein IWQ60_011217 [Tieghemiomyces parasiticus]
MSQRNVSNPFPPVRPPRSALRPRPSVGSALGFASSTSLASSTTPSVTSAPVLSEESRQPRWSRASNPTDQRASVSSVSTCSEATVRLSASPATSVRLESEPAPGPFPAPATVHALLSQHLAASTQPPNVADVFCAMARQIREVYARYCTNFDTAMACLAQLQQESGPRQFLEIQQRQLAGKTHAWDLASLLIKPVQRVLKYPLLFQQLAKLTATADPAAHAAFASAHRKAEALADHLNQAKRRIALVHRILDGHGALVSVNLGASDRLAVAALAKRSAPRRPSVRDSPARLIHTRSSANLRSPTTPQSTSRPPSPPGEPRRLSHSRSHATLARRGQSTAGAGGGEAGLKELSTSLRAGLVRTLGRGRTSRGELATASPSSSTTATPAAAATPPSLSPRRRSSAGQEAYTALIARFDHQLAAAHTFRRHSEAWLYAVARWSARWVQLAHSCHDFLGPEPGPHTVLFRAEALVRHAALAETVVVRDAAKAVATEVWPALQCLVGLFHNPALVIRRHTERYIDHVRFATLRQQGDTPLPTERNLAEAAAEYEMLRVQLSAELPVFLRHAADLFTAVTNRFLAVQTAFYARCARDLRTRFFDGDVVLDRIAPDYRLALTVPTHPHRFSYVGPARDDEGWDDRLAASAADLTRIDTLNMVPIRPSLSASTAREPSATVALSLSEKLERIHDNIKWCVDKSRHRVSQASTVASTLTPEAPMPSLLHLPPDEYAAVAHPARVKNRPGLSRESSLSRRRAVLIDFLQDAGVTENASTLFLPTPEGEVPGDPFRTPDESWSEAGSPHPSPPVSPHRALPSFFDSLVSLDSAATDLTPRTLSRQNSGPAPGVLSSVPRLPDVLLNRSDSWGLVGSLRSAPLTPADPFAGAEVRPADFVCFALSAYTAQAPYELNFAAGVPLVVRRVATLPTPEGPPAYWYHGELGPGGPRGWFPAEYALRNA